ncbi:MAG: hypothetical protein U0359_13385 [Byssovorax sp.]
MATDRREHRRLLLRLSAAPVLAAALLHVAPAHAGPPDAPIPAQVVSPPPTPRPNILPRWLEGPSRFIVVRAGEKVRIELVALDPDVDPLTYSIADAPKDAAFTARSGPGGSALFEWTPSAADAGEKTTKVTVSDGKGEAVQEIHIRVEESWTGLFMPGVGYSGYVPAAVGKWGYFQGVSAEIRAYSWVHPSPSPWPSHGAVYLDLDVLASTRQNVANAFHLSGGVEVSFEPNPSRKYLLPVYGLEVGVLFQRQNLGALAEVSPTLGLYLWSAPHLTVDLRAGYLLPLSAESFDDLRGLRAKLGVAFSSW